MNFNSESWQQPEPLDQNLPRYAPDIKFPPYRHIPGITPHPTRDPQGHSYGVPEIKPKHMPVDQWKENKTYLHGIDLYNFSYWWECHETLEGLWHAAGRVTTQAQYYQGIIQIAAAHIKFFHKQNDVAIRLSSEGVTRLQNVVKDAGQNYMGLDVEKFIETVLLYFKDKGEGNPVITLNL